jgi:hypothetical protein
MNTNKFGILLKLLCSINAETQRTRSYAEEIQKSNASSPLRETQGLCVSAFVGSGLVGSLFKIRQCPNLDCGDYRRFPTGRHVCQFQSAVVPAHSKLGHYPKFPHLVRTSFAC